MSHRSSRHAFRVGQRQRSVGPQRQRAATQRELPVAQAARGVGTQAAAAVRRQLGHAAQRRSPPLLGAVSGAVVLLAPATLFQRGGSSAPTS